MSARYILQQEGQDGYRFTLVTHGGEVLLTSGLYTDKDTALRHISAARSLARRRDNYELLTADDGQFYFVLRHARKGMMLGQSGKFPDAAEAEKGINAARARTYGARLEDQAPEPKKKQERPVKLW
jgi:uncharacterized protein YegP (UPF0339 family)